MRALNREERREKREDRRERGREILRAEGRGR
jgi:hypothetical protein